jgi:hypothetical protein
MSLEMMRADEDAAVRWVAAQSDRDAGRDLAWARADEDVHVRWVADYPPSPRPAFRWCPAQGNGAKFHWGKK